MSSGFTSTSGHRSCSDEVRCLASLPRSHSQELVLASTCSGSAVARML